MTRTAEGRYQAEAFPDWDIFGVTNGGYLLATAARAMAGEAEGRTLASIGSRFINPARPGPLSISVERLKVGRTLSVLRATVTAADRPILISDASFAEGSPDPIESVLVDGSPPDLPPVESCVRLEPADDSPLPPPFSGQVEIYLHPEDLVYFGEEISRVPLIRGWFRLLDRELLDPIGLVLASDAFPPAVFNSGLPVGWTPTIDLTVHIREPGPHEWLRCRLSTRFVTGGWLEEDGEFWDVNGRLVSQSRQLALLAR